MVCKVDSACVSLEDWFALTCFLMRRAGAVCCPSGMKGYVWPLTARMSKVRLRCPESPSQPFLVSSRNAPLEERCVTTLKTAARETRGVLVLRIIDWIFNRTRAMFTWRTELMV